MPEKKIEEKKLVPWDPPGVPRVPISGPVHGMFSKFNVLGPIGSRGHSHTTFSNGRFHERQSSFHIDVAYYFPIFVPWNFAVYRVRWYPYFSNSLSFAFERIISILNHTKIILCFTLKKLSPLASKKADKVFMEHCIFKTSQ